MQSWSPASRAFVGTRMLAPMVRVGTLPMRLLSLDYGADFVYGPEIVDKRIIGSERIVNELLGTVDYVKNGTLNFRTAPREKSRLVFQLGTADPELAVQAAQLVAQDVAYVDVNCGCPKHFSLQGGMGAALLETPDKLVDILTALVKHSPVPVTCKIRMLPDRATTLALIDRLVATGISALAIHCRTRFMTPQDPGDWSFFTDVASQFGTRLPILVNGDVFDASDLDRAFGLRNVSGPPRPVHEVMQAYVRYAIRYDMIYQNTKRKGKQLAQTRGLRAIAEFFGIEDEHDALWPSARRGGSGRWHDDGEDLQDGEASLGHKDWNKDGGDEKECPYIPNAPYIPTKKRKTGDVDGADLVAVSNDEAKTTSE
ncbi:hypothetical protein BCR44DRAFT_1434156 [Catenaria anguillulae PL171]|uniref:DUS-like FMN-binding domain-containing protein n=1 Tax=Catenaria anguillulae PL171 TaxID=765915 RepID=A0A1Y2HLG6_9FUNG|nr:hypothetical protein BCR44DRAFT_1434156 [Catenaria anguillulae PL171]